MLKMLKYLNIKQCPVTVFWTIFNISSTVLVIYNWFKVDWNAAVLTTILGILTAFWTYGLVYYFIRREHRIKDAEDAFEQALKEKEPKKVGKDYYL